MLNFDLSELYSHFPAFVVSLHAIQIYQKHTTCWQKKTWQEKNCKGYKTISKTGRKKTNKETDTLRLSVQMICNRQLAHRTIRDLLQKDVRWCWTCSGMRSYSEQQCMSIVCCHTARVVGNSCTVPL